MTFCPTFCPTFVPSENPMFSLVNRLLSFCPLGYDSVEVFLKEYVCNGTKGQKGIFYSFLRKNSKTSVLDKSRTKGQKSIIKKAIA